MFKTLLFNPLYNALIATVGLTGGDIGLAIIILTILVKVIIAPLYAKSVRTQIKMKEIEPKLAEIKEKYKNDAAEQSRKLVELYKDNNINPFSTFLVLLIQIPIILTLFYVFRDSFNIHKDIIYSFISVPTQVNTIFLGLIDITTSRNIILAVLTGLTQYIQVQFSLVKPVAKKNSNENSFKDDLARSMDLQMRYVMPIFIIFVSYGLPVALSLYWITSNIISIGYEFFIRRKIVAEAK